MARTVAAARTAVEAATRPEAPLAKAALSALPARAAEAPEARRCEVRAYVLRAAIAPAATERSPKRAVALRAAAEVLRADPACGPALEALARLDEDRGIQYRLAYLESGVPLDPAVAAAIHALSPRVAGAVFTADGTVDLTRASVK